MAADDRLNANDHRRMKAYIIMAALCLTSIARAQVNDMRLWYRQPARIWEEALPLGNGRLGAMVFGGIETDRIQFNEDTLWTGQPRDYLRPHAREALPEIQKAIFDGNDHAAAQLVRNRFLSSPVRQKAYQPFGDLHFTFPEQWGVAAYVRELDLSTAISTTSYTFNGIQFSREAFASYPDNLLAIRLAADKPAQLSVAVRLTTPHKRSAARVVSADTVAVSGQVQDNVPPHELGLTFEARLRVQTTGGRVSCKDDGTIQIENADAVTLLLVAATSFARFDDISADPAQRCSELLSKVEHRSYESLRETHILDYQSLFQAAELSLGRSSSADEPTDVRLRRLSRAVNVAQKTGKSVAPALASDPALCALYFQMGRYMLIASSRPGSQPANLQGVWNELLNPPWESKFTTNINLQMNYWLANLTGLSSCEAPLFDMIDDLRLTGARVANEQYGARGWVLHHNTDLWRGAAPINNIDGMWPTGGAWLCWHLWEHYRFTGDRAFLATRAYPAMKEACLFFLDTLVPDPRTGQLVTNPSHSPEQGPLNAGPAMDMQLIRALFDSTTAAAAALKVDDPVLQQIATARAKLAPDQIGRHGQLQEWQDDFDQPDNNHRHMSPLWGLYPGEQFTPADDRLFRAAKTLLRWRGDGTTGWSYAWRIPLWARVGDGEFSARQLALQLCNKTSPNLFDKCGPFQVDGNFGATAGVVEMLLQSHQRDPATGDVVICLLPALPSSWPDGAVSGLHARGGFVVDISWSAGKLRRATIRASAGGRFVLRYDVSTRTLALNGGAAVVVGEQLQSIQ